MNLSIVVPLYNEELIIKTNLEKIYNFFIKKFNFEIIVVNDGSTDNSLEIIKRLKIKNINLINNQSNLGKGNAIKKGIMQSKGEIVLITDADLSTSIDQFDILHKKILEGYEIVIGSRKTKNAKILLKQSISRIIAGEVFNFFVNIFLNLNFKDTQCGFKLFEGAIIRKLMEQSFVNRFCIDVEILFIAKKLKLNIIETGIQWANHEISSVSLFKDSINMFNDLIRIKLNNYNL